MSKGKYYFSKSLEKGLRILGLFKRDSPVLTQSEIARTLGLNMTSTYRYINTLVEMGYLEKDAKTKEIRPSTNCLAMSINLMQATDKMRMIREIVDQLHAEHNITIDVAFTVDDTLMRIYHREAEEVLTYSLPNYTKNCLHNTALGKAYLSTLSEDQLNDKLAVMELPAKTAATITSTSLLYKEISKTRKRGYALQVEEYMPGVLAIAAPLFDPIKGMGTGAVSFDFSILQHNAEDIVQQYGELIQTTARKITELLPDHYDGR